MLIWAKARVSSRNANAIASAASASGWLARRMFHFGDPEREETGLDSGGTVHAPGGIDERLDELGFGDVFGVELIQEVRLGGR